MIKYNKIIYALRLSSLSGVRRSTYAGSVVSGTKDELRGSIVARADVGHIGLSADQLLSTAHKITAHNHYHHHQGKYEPEEKHCD